MTEQKANGPGPAGPAPSEKKDPVNADWLAWLLLAGAWLAAAWVYPGMPERMPTHWNIHGQVDGYGGRFVGVLLLPLSATGLYLLLLALPRLDPFRANYTRFRSTFRLFRLLLPGFLILLWGLTIASAKGWPVRLEIVLPACIALLFIVLGNYLGRVKPNWFIGIRTPWTLSSEAVWRDTHRVGGRLFVLGGALVLLCCPFGPAIAGPAMLAFIIGITLFSFVYSFLRWRKEQAHSPDGPADHSHQTRDGGKQ